MRALRASIVSFVLLTIITSVIYPALVTGIVRVAFKNQSDGSLIEKDGKVVGSTLIAQNFSDAKYFWSRPSAANYDAANSAGSNMGPTNPDLKKAISDRIAALRAADPTNTQSVPADLVTASASGLDPEISPAAAKYQVSRVAKARGISEADLQQIVDRNTEGRSLGFLGEPRVNVLKLNLALDAR